MPRLPEGPVGRTLLFAASLVLGALSASWLSQVWLDLSDRQVASAPALSIQGASRLSPDAVAAAANWQEDASAIEAQIESHPWVREARVMRLPTGNWLVRVQERTPLFRLAETPPRLVDEDGVAFAEASPSDAALPLVRLVSAADPTPALREALAILRELDTRRLEERLAASQQPLELSQSEPETHRGWVLHAPRHELEVILGEGDAAPRLTQLERLLASTLATELPGTEVDLRFAERAIVRSAASGARDTKEFSPASG